MTGSKQGNLESRQSCLTIVYYSVVFVVSVVSVVSLLMTHSPTTAIVQWEFHSSKKEMKRNKKLFRGWKWMRKFEECVCIEVKCALIYENTLITKKYFRIH